MYWQTKYYLSIPDFFSFGRGWVPTVQRNILALQLLSCLLFFFFFKYSFSEIREEKGRRWKKGRNWIMSCHQLILYRIFFPCFSPTLLLFHSEIERLYTAPLLLLLLLLHWFSNHGSYLPDLGFTSLNHSPSSSSSSSSISHCFSGLPTTSGAPRARHHNILSNVTTTNVRVLPAKHCDWLHFTVIAAKRSTCLLTIIASPLIYSPPLFLSLGLIPWLF